MLKISTKETHDLQILEEINFGAQYPTLEDFLSSLKKKGFYYTLHTPLNGEQVIKIKKNKQEACILVSETVSLTPEGQKYFLG